MSEEESPQLGQGNPTNTLVIAAPVENASQYEANLVDGISQQQQHSLTTQLGNVVVMCGNSVLDQDGTAQPQEISQSGASQLEQQPITVITEDGQHILTSYSTGDGNTSANDLASDSECEEPSVEPVGIVEHTETPVWGVDGLGDVEEEGAAQLPTVVSGSDSSQFFLSLNATAGDDSSGLISDTATLQSLLASGAARLTNAKGEPIQIVTVAPDQAMAGEEGGGKVWHVVNNPAGGATCAIVTSPQETTVDQGDGQTKQDPSPTTQVIDLPSGLITVSDNMSSLLMPPPPRPNAKLPPNCPVWAARLEDCERIGDAFRGWVETEIELDLLLTFHKQQTQSFWGTRQSPSPAKQSTRLMWKSQYVPFDGIPFINAGSRAIVMECQFGPRRKGSHIKKVGAQVVKDDFRQTCPARIYIKKVRKFVEYQVDLNQDKKSLKVSMDRAFQLLKETGLEDHGHERFYVQLPTDDAHEFHSTMDQSEIPLTPRQEAPQRLDPRVAQKIRNIVAGGEPRLYAVRKALRNYVEKELPKNADGSLSPPEKHNLSFYPTVNDLQNHIHQAIKDIEGGVLPITAQTVNVEVVANGDGSRDSDLQHALWQSGLTGDSPHAETVTVTLTQNPGEDGQHIISRVETHLSDGTTQVSTTLTPETARLLAKLHPNMFPATGLLQVTLPVLPDTDSAHPITIVNHPIAVDEDLVVGHSAHDLDPTAPTYGVMEQVEGSTVLEPMEVSMVSGDNDMIKVEIGPHSDSETDVLERVVEDVDDTSVLMGDPS